MINNEVESSDYDYVCKIAIVGDSAVGKSNVLSRFIFDRFEDKINPTIGVDFATKIVKNKNNKLLKLQIWDTAGQEKFKSITNSYYINSKAILVVFDLTRRETFNNCSDWISDIREVIGNNVFILLIGNKLDLNENRIVSNEEAINFSKKLNVEYIEASALNGLNVNEAFKICSDYIFENIVNKIEVKKSFSLSENEEFVNNDSNSKCSC